MRQFLLTALLVLAGLASVSAQQQYGHLNFGNLIAQMPGTEAADAELAAYNQELVSKGEQMVTNLRARVAEIEAQVEDLPPVEVEKYRVELNEDRQQIAVYEQQMQVDLGNKRQELLGPIVDEARAAVKAVAEEKGYLLVFDTSQFNTILFAQESDDLMELVKAKLGL